MVFSWPCKTLKSQYKWWGTSGGFSKMAWTQIVSQAIASSSVVVCDCLVWCVVGAGGVFFQLDPTHACHPRVPYKRHSWYYSCASKSLQIKQGKLPATIRPLYLKLTWFPVQATCFYVVNFSKLIFLKTIKVCTWSVFPNPVTFIDWEYHWIDKL